MKKSYIVYALLLFFAVNTSHVTVAMQTGTDRNALEAEILSLLKRGNEIQEKLKTYREFMEKQNTIPDKFIKEKHAAQAESLRDETVKKIQQLKQEKNDLSTRLGKLRLQLDLIDDKRWPELEKEAKK